jgi:hypothetical protein
MSSQKLSEYYPSTRGLGVTHLFATPVELLALGKKFKWKLGRLTSTKGIKPPPPSNVKRFLRDYTSGILIPAHLNYLVSSSNLHAAQPSLTKVLGVIIAEYFLTSDIVELLQLKAPLDPYYVRNVRRQCKLTGTTLQVIQKELTLQLMTRLQSDRWEMNRKFAYAYFRRLNWLKAMLSTFDNVCLAFQRVRMHGWYISSHTRRTLERLKLSIVSAPFNTALALKELAFQARNFYFGGAVPHCEYSSLLTGMSRVECLHFSYNSRAYSAPLPELMDEEGHLNDLRGRLTSNPTPEHPEWRSWISKYWAEHRPREIVIKAQPSTSGCLGRPRWDGGHRKGYTDLILFEMGHMSSSELLKFSKSLRKKLEGSQEAVYGNLANTYACRNTRVKQIRDIRKPSGSQLNTIPKLTDWGKVSSAETAALNELMLRGAERVLDLLPILPVFPVLAPEKGLKTRIPTEALTASNVIQQAFRSAADEFLRQDPRVSESLGGSKKFTMGPGPYLSQDLSVSTDLHDFWLTEIAYEELIEHVPILERFRRHLPKLLGPKAIIYDSQIRETWAPNRDVLKSQVPDWAKPKTDFFLKCGLTMEYIQCDQLYEGDLFDVVTSNPNSTTSKSRLADFKTRYSTWLDDLLDLPFYVTTKGEMMGDPTSWALLPLVTLFCTEKHGLTDVVTCGDDAWIGGFFGKKEFFARLTRMGAEVSWKKTFSHAYKGLFTEDTYEYHDGHLKKLRRTMFTLWVGPPGGSKGEVNWFNLPSSAKSVGSDFTLHKYSRFKTECTAALKLGIPLGAPVFMGGIGHPKYGVSPHLRLSQWMDYLSSLKVKDLLLRGGLTLMPTPRSDDEVNLIWQFVLPRLSKTSGMPIETALLRLRNLPGIRGIYFRRYSSIKQTPSVWNLAQKLARRIRRAKSSGMVGSPYRVFLDISDKKNYYLNVEELPNELSLRNFGVSVGRAPPWDLSSKDANLIAEL